MNNSKHSDNDLSTASAPLMIYSALAGVCAFLTLIISLALWPPEKVGLTLFAISTLISLTLGGLAWGIRNEKRWAWIPATGFATIFPIGTIISYFALTSLWKCRASFFPFSSTPAEQNAAEHDVVPGIVTTT